MLPSAGMDVVKLLGENVRRERQARGMTQEQLAFDADMKRSYLSDLERGLRNPTVQAFGRLGDARGVPPHSLLLPPEA